MNQQLTLIETETPSPAQKLEMNAGARKLSRKRKLSSELSDQAWWRLSTQERQQGLAGVRAIRAILQNVNQDPSHSMAKAS